MAHDSPNLDEVAVVHAILQDHGPGVMVDVGAHQGGSLRRFAIDGWRIYAFEPDPSNRQILEKRWSNRDNVVIDPRAVAERDGDMRSLFVSDVSTGISALAPFHPSHRVGAMVETVRLDTYLAGIDEVTFLKTDTEGWDLPVLRTFPWDRLSPLAVVCEFEDRKTVPLGYTSDDLVALMRGLEYSVFVSEWYPVVEYGRRHCWRSLRPCPAPLADQKAWGNLICVTPALKDRVMKYAGRRSRTQIRLPKIVSRLVRR